MKLAHTAEFAAMISAHADQFIRDSASLPDWALGRFHKYSRTRMHRWMRAVSIAESRYLNSEPVPGEAADRDLADLAERILIGEILNRVWVTTLISWDRRYNTKCAEPIARNVMLGHMLTRHQVLSVIQKSGWVTEEQRCRIEQVNRSVQRWSDMLTSHLLHRFDLWDLAYDEDRARDFAESNLRQNICDPQSRVWNLILVGLRLAFPERRNDSVLTTDLDREIIRSVIATFPPRMLSGTESFTAVLSP